MREAAIDLMQDSIMYRVGLAARTPGPLSKTAKRAARVQA
jgi:hypothetical protein